MDKRGIEFNFAVLFSIIVGAMIIFLAIYSASKIIHTGSSESQSSLTKQLTIIFDPMETGIASGKYKPFSFSINPCKSNFFIFFTSLKEILPQL